MKLNLGAGGYPLPGHLSVDMVPPADILGDFMDLHFEDVEAVEMSHVLEHLPWRVSGNALRWIRGWMAPGGTLRVEVPDCAAICAMGADDPRWQQWMFGSQNAPGEWHQAGFTVGTLAALVADTGWEVTSRRVFVTDHPARTGFPCAAVWAVAA